jgi:hypothetical protein
MRWEMHGGYAEDIGSAFKSLFGNPPPPLQKKYFFENTYNNNELFGL